MPADELTQQQGLDPAGTSVGGAARSWQEYCRLRYCLTDIGSVPDQTSQELSSEAVIKLKSVAVFCASSNDADPSYIDLAQRVGQRLAHERIILVYGGGYSGLMGAVAQATMEAGGEVTGVIPGGLFSNGIPEDEVTTLEVVADMHQRKARMYELSDGFIGLPGGLGTFEEVFEAATWTQLGLHAGGRSKTVVLLDEDGFWDGAHALLDKATAGGVLTKTNRPIIQGASSIDETLRVLRLDRTNDLPKFVNEQPNNSG